jgi:hypothetical protein
MKNENPPDDYSDTSDTDYAQATSSLVGKTLSNLTSQEIQMIYRKLNPLAEKIGWYKSRYISMKKTIDDLRAENKELRDRLRRFR